MIGLLKNFAPIILYAGSIFLILRALIGRTEWLLWFVIFLLPLRNVVDKLHMYPLGKDLVDILFMALLLGSITKAMTSKDFLTNHSPINAVAIVFIGYTFLSVLIGSGYLHSYNLFDFADPRVQTWKNLITLPILYFLTLHNIRTKKHVWVTIAVICFGMLLVNYYTSQQIAWYRNLVSRSKINGTFSYLGPNEVAAYYTQYTSLLLGLGLMLKKRNFKTILLGLCAWNAFIVLFLFSRAAYAALATGLLFLAVIKKRVLVIPIVLIAFCWHLALPARVQERILETTNEYGELDRSSEERLLLWQNALELFAESPITGLGFRTFKYVSFNNMDTHNIYLRTLAEQGIIGFFIFLLLLMMFFIQGFRLYMGGDDESSKGLGLGLMACILALMVSNFFGDRWSYIEVSSNLWVFAALVSRLIILEINSKHRGLSTTGRK